ncbi:cytochrome c3 family protein [Pedosphaera parvula]|uniref:cytochrome c3 family protein n=1 Tax=Pedosphaera parvula TaxID=1032527 RepID=UPI000A02562B|nr:cytochrome c3 family protein [Pedosphaera parvula]
MSLGIGSLVLLLNSCSTTDRTIVAPPQIEGATFVGDKACLECHANISHAFPASPHARLRLEKAGMPGVQGCESCHGPASKHVAVGGGRGRFIINPGKDPQSCFQCHLETEAAFHLPQHHPLIEGKMNCVQCHDPHGLDIMKPKHGLAMSRLNETCSQCHREQTRPFVFEHEALREGCIVCHSPHGSINAKMLIQRDSNLCLKCHAQIQGPGAGGTGHIFIGKEDHTDHLRYGTCWTAGCHTAIHGSNINPHMFY